MSAMTAQQYLDTYRGQSLLYAPSQSREPLRGQCVQAVCFYVADNGKPVIWADAYLWWASNLYPEHYERIANTGAAVPAPGDIVVWGPKTPGSGGAGHIAVCLQPKPGTGTFVSVDQNWGGKTLHTVTHNYDNVVGWLRLKNLPTVSITPRGDEMIANEQQAHQAYQLLRINGDGSPAEIAATANKRSWAQFANDAKAEITQRNANAQAQANKLNELSNTINSLNQSITDLQTEGVKNKQDYDAKVSEIAKLTAELTTAHDQIKDLQNELPYTPEDTRSNGTSTSAVTKFFVWLLRKKS
jgi:cell division protein FtsB